MTSSKVGEVLHLQHTDLIKTSSENIDNVAIVGRAFGEGVVELELGLAKFQYTDTLRTDLDSLLVVLNVVTVDIVVGTNRLFQFR